MPFATERQAKQFLADKIYQQSQLAGAPISDVDRRLLLFSEQDPGSEKGIPEDMLSDLDLEWEQRMTDLLRQAWRRDKENPAERQLYLDAMERMKASDHYIQVIADPVFGRSLFGTGGPSGLQEIQLGRILPWIGVGMVLFGIIALIWMALTR